MASEPFFNGNNVNGTDGNGTNGNGTNGSSTNGHSDGASGIAGVLRTAMFWQKPLEDGSAGGITTHPPLPSHDNQRDATSRLIHELAGFHTKADRDDFAYQGWYLRWFYETRAVAAQRELEDVVAEVQGATRRYAALLQETPAFSPESRQAAAQVLAEESDSPGAAGASLDALLVRARHDFTDAAATAAIPVDTGAARVVTVAPLATGKKLKKGAPDVSVAAPAGEAGGGFIGPTRVEEALDRAAPTHPEIAGLFHLRFPGSEWNGDEAESAGGWRGFMARFAAGLLPMAPLVLGLMVALCLGSVSGLVDIDALVRMPTAASLFKFVLAVLLGGIIVLVLGKGTESTMRILFDHLNTHRLPGDAPSLSVEGRSAWSPSPRRRKSVVVVAVTTLFLFAFAEVAAEGTGLRVLNDLRLANLSQDARDIYYAHPIAPAMFYLVGVLFSGAYLFFKGSDSWRKSELETLRPWFERKRQEWLEGKRASVEVRRLIQLAHLIEQMESHRAGLGARLDRARAAAVSEAELLHAMVEWLVNQRDPMPMPTVHVIQDFDGQAPDESASRNGKTGRR